MHDPDWWAFNNDDGKLECCDMKQFNRDLDAAIEYSKQELRNMAESTFVEEWTRPAAKQRYPYNLLHAEAMRRGYNAEGKQVTPAKPE
jgi:hypothetical protein